MECFDEDGNRIDPDVGINIAYVQQQKGAIDCGLFAIAFAYHLAAGEDPEKLFFHQNKMRLHLSRYAVNYYLNGVELNRSIDICRWKKMTPFPHTTVNVL